MWHISEILFGSGNVVGLQAMATSAVVVHDSQHMIYRNSDRNSVKREMCLVNLDHFSICNQLDSPTPKCLHDARMS